VNYVTLPAPQAESGARRGLAPCAVTLANYINGAASRSLSAYHGGVDVEIVSALAAGAVVAAAGAAHAQENITLRIGVMNGRATPAQAPVEISNTTGTPIRPSELGCDFISVGHVVVPIASACRRLRPARRPPSRLGRIRRAARRLDHLSTL